MTGAASSDGESLADEMRDADKLVARATVMAQQHKNRLAEMQQHLLELRTELDAMKHERVGNRQILAQALETYRKVQSGLLARLHKIDGQIAFLTGHNPEKSGHHHGEQAHHAKMMKDNQQLHASMQKLMHEVKEMKE